MMSQALLRGMIMTANVKKPASAADKTIVKKGSVAPVVKSVAGSVRTSRASDVESLPAAAAKTGSVKKAGQADAGVKGAKVTEPSQRVPQATVGSDKFEKPVVSKVSEVATKNSPNIADAKTGDGLLTEAQVLKMSDKDYMNEAQLAFFKARLQQLERELVKNAGETTEHLRETVLVPDPADRATIEEEHALELRTRDRERKLLKKVQQSIASIDTGEYGWCEETGEPIGVPRLLARPTATLSLEAQQRRELKQKLYGD